MSLRPSNMNISTTSPLVASEPRISLVPIFSVNESKAITESTLTSQYKGSNSNLQTFCTLTNLDLPGKDTKSKTTSAKTHCKCPQILVADDDAFQHLYYKILCKKALRSGTLDGKSGDLCFDSSFSGEELLDKLERVTECGCKTTKLVIIDYQMGEKKLNGVETCIKVRKDGYKGQVLLRTSETEDSLKKTHLDFEQLFQDKTINMLVNKSDASFGESLIRKVVTEEIRSF